MLLAFLCRPSGAYYRQNKLGASVVVSSRLNNPVGKKNRGTKLTAALARAQVRKKDCINLSAKFPPRSRAEGVEGCVFASRCLARRAVDGGCPSSP